MKKLLVILMLGSGFVTVASADPHNCLRGDTNKCCIDVVNVQNAINQSRGTGYPTSKGGYNVLDLDVDLLNDATTTICETKAFAAKDGEADGGVVKWIPANWATTSVFTAEPLDCTHNTTNQCCVDVHSMDNQINQSPPNYSITTTDNYELLSVSPVLVNDGTDGYNSCLDYAVYKQNDGQRNLAYFQWVPNNWVNTIKYYGPSPSVNKDNAIPLTPLNPPLSY